MKVTSLYQFGPFRLQLPEHLLLRDGRPVPLTPKAFEILAFLVENNGRLVRKDELMKRIWPESFVEESNLTVNISALRKALGPGQPGQEYIETVPRLGYRFNARVEEVEDSLSELPYVTSHGPQLEASLPAEDETAASVATHIERAMRGGRRAPPLWVSAVFGVTLLTLLVWTYRKRSAEPPATHPRSLAILPFRNLRPDPDSDFLELSLADAVITKLGYVSALTVRPTSAVEKYRGQTIDIGKVATDLNIDTLLAGNFVHDGDDLRVTVQLVDVRSQKTLWQGSFDAKFEKLLTVQDNVAREIISGLEVTLSPSERERFKSVAPVDPLAYEYYLRGVDLYSRSDFSTAIKMLEKSTELEPNYAMAWAHLGRSYTANASFEFGGREQYGKAQSAYERALSLEPGQIEASIYLANLLTDTGRVEQAVPLLRQALKANSNHAEAHWELGYAYRFAGVLPESVAECVRARQLDPGVKLNSSALNSYLYLGQYARFLESLPQSDSALILFYRGFGEYHLRNWTRAMESFDLAYQQDPSLLQVQVGRALSDALKHQEPEGLAVLRDTENRIAQRGVGDPEAIYKIAQAYGVLGDKAAALRVLKRSIEGGFFSYPYFVIDPLLNNLRHEDQFALLMTAARQRHEAFRRAYF